MPTPTRGVWQLGGCEAGGWFGSIASPEGCKGKRGRSREGPPAQTDEAEACDKRSRPQVVTSAWVRHGGVNLQQEVVPHLTERPPRAGILVSKSLQALKPARQVSLDVRRQRLVP